MLKLAVCDDDAQILKQLCEIIEAENKKSGDLSVTAFGSSTALLSALEEGAGFDLFILDILMPNLTGMELATAIRRTDEASQIVFLTSSPEFAVDSYEVDALGYILKPVSAEKLAAVLSKARLNMSRRRSDGLLLQQSGRLRTVPIFSVACVEAMRNKLTYYLCNGETLECYGTINEAAEKLCADARFIRPHRSYIVNMEYIREFDGKGIRLVGAQSAVPVSRGSFQQLKERYIEYMVHMAGGAKSDA